MRSLIRSLTAFTILVGLAAPSFPAESRQLCNIAGTHASLCSNLVAYYDLGASGSDTLRKDSYHWFDLRECPGKNVGQQFGGALFSVSTGSLQLPYGGRLGLGHFFTVAARIYPTAYTTAVSGAGIFGMATGQSLSTGTTFSLRLMPDPDGAPNVQVLDGRLTPAVTGADDLYARAQRVVGTTNVTINTWHDVVLTNAPSANGTDTAVYSRLGISLDGGAFVWQSAGGDGYMMAPQEYVWAGNFSVGSEGDDCSGGEDYFVGIVADVAIYNRGWSVLGTAGDLLFWHSGTIFPF